MNKFNLIFIIFLLSISSGLKSAHAEPNESVFKCSSSGPINCDAVTDLGHSIIVKNPRLVHGGEELKFSAKSVNWSFDFTSFLQQQGFMICKLNGLTNGAIVEFDHPPWWDRVTSKRMVELGIAPSGQIEIKTISNEDFVPVQIIVTELKCIK